jgi:predicted ABC-type sugar transport system permease subunit
VPAETEHTTPAADPSPGSAAGHAGATPATAAATGDAAPAAPGRRSGLRGLLGSWEALLVALLVVLLVAGQAVSSEFLTTDSFTTGSLDFSEIALMALALTLVIVAAEIDLSIASVLRCRARSWPRCGTPGSRSS